MSLVIRAGRLAALALAGLVPLCAAATAHEFKAGDLVIEHPWSRATPVGAQVAGGYFTITNKGTAPDRLIGGTFEASSGFELHEMSMDGGVMKMRPLGPIEIPAGASVTFDLSGKHVMLTGLKRGLKKGQDIAGTLVFEHAGTVPVRFAVEGLGAKGPAKDGAAAPAGQSMPGMTMD